MNQTLTKSKAVMVCHLILAALLFALQPVAPAAAETVSAPPAAAPAPAAGFTAKWIWRASAATNSYNQTIIAQKKFTLGEVRQATLRITADSFYRLFINGQWVNDGPGRSWPEHFQYDVIDATPFLVEGANEIRVVARYFGVGDFHRVPKQAGLLAQLDVTLASGKTNTVGTDGSWDVADWPALVANTPKASIQMEPCELFDARLADKLAFQPAAVLYAADQGPWRNLTPRDSALLTKQPFAFKTLLAARVVKADGWNFCVPAARLVNPGLIEANHSASCALGMATLVETDTEVTLNLQNEGMKMAVDGERVDHETKLKPGRHLLLAFARSMFGHDKEKAVRFMNPKGFKLRNPLDAASENPWVFIRFPEFAVVTNDLVWLQFRDRELPIGQLAKDYAKRTDDWLGSIKDLAGFEQTLARRSEPMSMDQMFVQDVFWQFTERQVVGDAASLVANPAGSLHDNPEFTTVLPSPAGDVELLYDLGEQNCGYWNFDLVADAGVQVDIFAVEYIAPDGRIQFPGGNRNGLRYITQAGDNRFTSLKRRSGRYVFLTLRNQHAPVRIRHFNLIESTYPVNYIGNFACSDARLDRIWDISTRTLKLCMEDTFTDCPLYEQTHWVGDARNESLLAYGVFGAHDLARRCIDITAQSLERYPIAGCQTPSSWDVLIPAWSLLWGISTWDYYWATGDTNFLRGVYPAVIRNLKGAEQFVDSRDLFTGPFWNFFDWVKIDQGQKTVLHNSMFLVGAIDVALQEGKVLGDTTHAGWLQALRGRLVGGINKLWDDTKQAYPDAIRDDGSISPSICQHTSFLGLLYDIVPPEHAAAARKNLTDPPEKMVLVGSPFAALYLYEACEKLGLDDEIIKEIYKHYLPMVEAGATTVWESFPSGTTGGGGFPTRSHCHAWSSAPTRFLNRIILGVKETAPGGAVVQISPRLNGLTWARGTVATVRGPVTVAWKLEGEKLNVQYSAPAGVQADFRRNDTHGQREVVVNGKRVD
ncbi:MAG: alpha-L-rhamnosidase N-terminal domain-containing protein [Verrucomicrobiota bacterium]